MPALLRAPLQRDSPDAFFFPQRLLAALLGSLALSAALTAAIMLAADHAELLASHALLRSGLLLPSVMASPGTGALLRTFRHCLQFWAAAAMALNTLQWVATMVGFRAAALLARRGAGPFAASASRAPSRAAAGLLIGAATGSTAACWLVVTVLGAAMSLPLVWPPWQAAIGEALFVVLPALASVVLAWVFSSAIATIMTACERAGRAGNW